MSEHIHECENRELHKDKIAHVVKFMPKPKEMEKLSDFFKVVSDGTRLKLLMALEFSELCGCDLCEIMNMTKSAISHQLRVLRQANLVKARKSGKNVFYSLSDKHVQDLILVALEHVRE